MTTRVLVGTTNPSKVERFRGFLKGYDVELLTLKDLGITDQPEETGRDPEENARQKAAFYSRYFDTVLCNDSGLYLLDLPLDDPRQPGLQVRSPHGVRLNDEEMIAHYSALARSLGGRVLANYYDGMAVSRGGRIVSWMDHKEYVRATAFWLVDTPAPGRKLGWPLDSISINRYTGTYFVEAGCDAYDGADADADPVIYGEYRRNVIDFLVSALGLTKPTP